MIHDADDAQTDTDALELLIRGHREVRELFDAYANATSVVSKARLAHKVFSALEVHMSIEEEIFYPAFKVALHDQAMVHEAEGEHGKLKDLIASLRAGVFGQPGDKSFDARIHEMERLVDHHVHDEESEMFPAARGHAKLDLTQLGQQMMDLKTELEDLAPA